MNLAQDILKIFLKVMSAAQTAFEPKRARQWARPEYDHMLPRGKASVCSSDGPRLFQDARKGALMT